MKQLTLLIAVALTTVSASARTLIAYYSYTNNVHAIATELQKQTGADIVRIQPAEKGLLTSSLGHPNQRLDGSST